LPWQAAQTSGETAIPVYDVEGKNVIGEFFVITDK
jgi:hypothetical protein